ncbi:unnamed protein product, partial [Didymodactylos carnosus]
KNAIITVMSSLYSNNQSEGTAIHNGMSAPQSTWIDKFTEFDKRCSESLLYLLYRIIDISLLINGLRNGKCENQRLRTIAIVLLVFYLIDLSIIIVLFIRKFLKRSEDLTVDNEPSFLKCASAFRGLFLFCKLIPTCFGTVYCFQSTIINQECELLRVSVGIVCISTWLLMLMPPTRPEIPVRRSLLMECFILVFVLIINGAYVITILVALPKTNEQKMNDACTYKVTDDLYLGAPLITFAYVGIFLYSLTTLLHILNLAVNRFLMRLSNGGNTAMIKYYFVYYWFSYLYTVVIIYYFSVGALYLFRPNNGQPCKQYAPNLYKTLLVWQWIRILVPLIAVPLVVVLCCVGVVFGILLTYCLPASITVPLFEIIRRYLPSTPGGGPNPINLPATRDSINALPMVVFGQFEDQFAQTECKCAICRTDFQPNLKVKKLGCGHLFHSECVDNWLSSTAEKKNIYP